MANNGQAADALGYYLKALDLNPAYIRARCGFNVLQVFLLLTVHRTHHRFNLGISCIHLRVSPVHTTYSFFFVI